MKGLSERQSRQVGMPFSRLAEKPPTKAGNQPFSNVTPVLTKIEKDKKTKRLQDAGKCFRLERVAALS